MSRWVRSLLVIVVSGVVIFGIGALLVIIFGNAPYVYTVCALGFASFILNFSLTGRRRRRRGRSVSTLDDESN